MAPAMGMEKAVHELQTTFGFPSFRGLQEPVVRRIVVENKSAVVIMPTGGGKSLCFQLPAVLFQGLTVVVSPLISLMKDQVGALRAKGVKAASLDSSLSYEETVEVKNALRDGSLSILYVAPERLNNEQFLAMMHDVEIDLLAVDESHCISEWGNTFRPDYLKVARFAQEFKVKRVLALTATATPKVAKDICSSFGVNEIEGLFRASSYRPNLHLNVISTPSDAHKMDMLCKLLQPHTCGPTIIYVTTRKEADRVAALMANLRFPVKPYHAGMENDDRKMIQDWFMDTDGVGRVVVATIAFGMGVDKANIRNIIHYKLPKSLESYSQEIGRAGRDALVSYCTEFMNIADIPILEGFIRATTPSRAAIQKLLRDIFEDEPAEAGDVIDVSFYDNSAQFDILITTVHIIYTYLEIHHGLIRATTPYYKEYKFQQLLGFQETRQDQSPAAKAILTHMVHKITWTHIDIDRILKSTGDLDRGTIVSKLDEWETNGWIKLQTAGVRNTFVLRNSTPDASTLESISNEMYERMIRKEGEDVQRLRNVIDFVTHTGCLARQLADYFGDGHHVPAGGCQNCTWCTTHSSFTVPEREPFSKEKVRQLVEPILAECAVRDDARFLARVAYGIFSPRTRKLEMQKELSWGSLDHVDFDILLEVFEEVCEAAGWRNTNGDPEYGLRLKSATWSPKTPSSSQSKRTLGSAGIATRSSPSMSPSVRRAMRKR